MSPIADRSRVLAVLGPTNTGKTYLAIERMLSYASGIIGFPLRLLARENYDRLVREKGRARVALVTGEEKIVPQGAEYFACTVESMPLDRAFEFLAIDEIQLAADPERGHVFTDRLLNARGLEETMVLGAETIRPLIRRLVPDAEFLSRPRFSQLTYSGPRKLTRLPPRSAVVTFSATEVYQTAELLRRQRGGTAVVLGALSPRTRNAQVSLYQSGEVDYLVATDAIGMGLNMDVDHVAFARLDKFDGRVPRRLRAPEVAQIAGRAGRHLADGTFGTTAEIGPLEPEIVEAVETHSFDPLSALMWRNTDLDFRSPDHLLRSLERRPPVPVLRRAAEADDHMALAALAKEPAVIDRTSSRAAVRILWDVCQIPDFRKILSDAHTRLLGEVFRQLTGPHGRLDTDWVARQIAHLARTDGDIDTLVGRLAHIRTWTYIAHRGDWVADPRHWQGKARSVEDLLSDALHERLTQRFVDRRQAVLVKSLKSGGDLLAAVTRTGDVVVEGEHIGRIEGFRFRPDTATHAEDARALMGAARRALKDEIAARVRRLEAAPHEAVALAPDGTLLWHGVTIARIAAGAQVLAPAAKPLASDLLEPQQRDRIAQRLTAWLGETVAETLAPLFRLRQAELSGPARGLAFQIAEGLGTLRRADVADMVATLDKSDRRRLQKLGVEIGGTFIFLPRLLKPRQVAMRGLLWAVARGAELPPPLPAAGSLTAHADTRMDASYYLAIGYPLAGDRACRADRLEALSAACAKLGRQGPFVPTPKLSQLAGCPMTALPGLLESIGFKGDAGPDGVVTYQRRPDRRRGDRRPKPQPDSPFAKLQALSARR